MHNIFGAADTGHSNGLEPLLMEFLGGNFLQINWLIDLRFVMCTAKPSQLGVSQKKANNAWSNMVSLKQR